MASTPKRTKAQRQDRLKRFREALFRQVSSKIGEIEAARGEKEAAAPKIMRKAAAREKLRIGIVGGGHAGMYAALLLHDLGIDYHIFEASGERMGGRVLTHYFDNAPHQYAELGAMRFPFNFMQDRLFKTWGYLNGTAASVPGAREIPKIPYILFDDNPKTDSGNLLCFNGRKPVTRNEAEADNTLLGFDPNFEGPEWDYFKDDNGKLKSATELLDDALDCFVNIFENDKIEKAWHELQKYDSYSARAYLQERGDGTQPYPVRIVDYMETVLSYTGIYDLSLIELVLDTYSFDATDDWYAMDGGTSRISDELVNRIPGEKISMGAEVFKLEQSDDGKAVIHSRNGDGQLAKSETFDRVIVTLPFSVLRFVDTPKTWSPGKYDSIRMLKMTNAVKIALGFKSRFWESEGPYSASMKGGQSNTDLSVRSVVYPSFGIGDPGPAYILGSYSWQIDADKWTHLEPGKMLDLALRDVAVLHGEEIVQDQYLGHGTSVVWNREPLAGGGFEFFAAGQFGEAFVQAREPEGLFHFAGEHLDMVHYWIAGSYNSAFRTVWEVLLLEDLFTPATWQTLQSSMGGGDILPTMIPRFHNNDFGRANPAGIATAE